MNRLDRREPESCRSRPRAGLPRRIGRLRQVALRTGGRAIYLPQCDAIVAAIVARDPEKAEIVARLHVRNSFAARFKALCRALGTIGYVCYASRLSPTKLSCLWRTYSISLIMRKNACFVPQVPVCRAREAVRISTTHFRSFSERPMRGARTRDVVKIPSKTNASFSLARKSRNGGA